MKQPYLSLLFIVVLLFLQVSPVFSQHLEELTHGSSSNSEIKHEPPPPPPASPTIVKVGLFIRQITDVDQISEDFTIEGFMEWVWDDPRHIFDEHEYGYEEKMFINEEVEALLYQKVLWWPELGITNERGAREIEERALGIHSTGEIIYRERFSAKIQADFDLKRFPFDDQEFHIYIESFIYEHHDLELAPLERIIGFGENLGEEEWILQEIKTKVTDREDIRSETGDTFSELELDLEIHRQPNYYVNRVIIPILFIVLIFCATFLLFNYEMQLTASTTSLLTLVAFDFAISDSLPNLAYMTLMDSFIMVSFILAAMAIIINLIFLRLEQLGKKELAKKMNFGALVGFPIMYIISYIVIWNVVV